MLDSASAKTIYTQLVKDAAPRPGLGAADHGPVALLPALRRYPGRVAAPDRGRTTRRRSGTHRRPQCRHRRLQHPEPRDGEARHGCVVARAARDRTAESSATSPATCTASWACSRGDAPAHLDSGCRSLRLIPETPAKILSCSQRCPMVGLDPHRRLRGGHTPRPCPGSRARPCLRDRAARLARRLDRNALLHPPRGCCALH